MFARFFSALRLLTANAEALAFSFAEANQRFRANLALDATEETPDALPAPTDAEEPRRSGRGRNKLGA